MKKIIFIAIATVMSLCACHKIQSHDDSKVTYYLEMELVGESFYAFPINTAWTDPKCKVYENGVDVSEKLVITGTVDLTKPGYYPLMYSATNADGFSSVCYREVLVYDPSVTDDISGTYTTQAGTQRFYNDKTTDFPGISPITITKAYPGVFSVSCLIGGFYSMVKDYGENYQMNGMIQIDESDHSIKLINSFCDGFGDSLDAITNGTYDTTNGLISYNARYIGTMLFTIKLKKN